MRRARANHLPSAEASAEAIQRSLVWSEDETRASAAVRAVKRVCHSAAIDSLRRLRAARGRVRYADRDGVPRHGRPAQPRDALRRDRGPGRRPARVGREAQHRRGRHRHRRSLSAVARGRRAHLQRPAHRGARPVRTEVGRRRDSSFNATWSRPDKRRISALPSMSDSSTRAPSRLLGREFRHGHSQSARSITTSSISRSPAISNTRWTTPS
jgi:hypothetical protein